MRRKRIVQDDSDDESDTNSDNSTPSSSTAGGRRGRKPSAKKKRQRVQDDSDDDDSPQPSTSHDTTYGENAFDNPESGSGSESPDSDYGPERSRVHVQHKTQKKVRVAKQQNGVSSTKNVQRNNRLNIPKSQNSRLSQSVSNGISFDPKQVEAAAERLVYFLLIDDQKKYAIRKKAIVAAVFKNETYSPKYYSAVIKKANSILMKTYGMELMQLENQKDSYMVVNVLKRQLCVSEFVELSRLEQQQQGLILYILTLIYMNDNVITEEELRKSLDHLGIDLTAKKLHPVFGDAKKYIVVELVRQMYLQHECISKDPPKSEFTWGLRAKQELDKKDLLQLACQIMDDTSPEDWKIQYKDAEMSAKPDANR